MIEQLKNSPKILLVEACNFIDFPIGGQLSFARNILELYGSDIKLVGISTNDDIVGKWSETVIKDIHYSYFSVIKITKSSKKPLIPLRIKFYWGLKKYLNEILNEKFDIILVQAPESLVPFINKSISICYRFAGVENPLKISRYKIGRILSPLFDAMFFPYLKRTNLILASADSNEIKQVVKRSRGKIKYESIVQFPTRVNTSIFKKSNNKIKLRESLELPINDIIITTTGRLNSSKGWKFMIDSFQIFLKNNPKSILLFLGDGEDRELIQAYVENKKLIKQVFILGFLSPDLINNYLNASDLFIMGSIKEGWSTSLLEALICGLPACVTEFSSANDLIKNNINGIVVSERNPEIFANNMQTTLRLSINDSLVDEYKQLYSLSNLKNDLNELFRKI